MVHWLGRSEVRVESNKLAFDVVARLRRNRKIREKI